MEAGQETTQALPEALRDRYRLIRGLGAGSFGRVLLAEDTQLARPVAIKLLVAGALTSQAAVRFTREAKVTSQLRHPHIVEVFDSGMTPDGTPFIVYEYVEGKSLREVLNDDPPAPEVALEWGARLADALQVAHSAGVVHRDVKPENVLLRDGAHPVLCDFGLARIEGSGATKTAEGIILGTPAYIAPEVWLGRPPDEAGDQYALATTVYEAVYGCTPPGTEDERAILNRLRRGSKPRLPPGREGEVPAAETPLLRGLAADPESRFPDIARLGEALALAARQLSGGAPMTVGKATGAAAVTTRSRIVLREKPGERPGHRLSGALGLVVCLAAGGAGYFLASPRAALPGSATDGPRSTAAAPPPTAAPSARPTDPIATRELRELVARRRHAHHQLETPDYARIEPIAWRRHVYRFRFEYMHEDFRSRWLEDLDAFRGWLRPIPRVPSPDGSLPGGRETAELLIDAGLGWLRHSAWDTTVFYSLAVSVGQLSSFEAAKMQLGQGLGIGVAEARVAAAHRGVCEDASSLLAELESWPSPEPDLILALAASLRAALLPHVTDTVAAIDELLRRLALRPESIDAYWLARAVLDQLILIYHREVYPCGDRPGAVEALVQFVESQAAALGPARTFELRFRIMEVRFRDVTFCDLPQRQETYQEFDADLAALEAAPDQWPTWLPSALDRLHDYGTQNPLVEPEVRSDPVYAARTGALARFRDLSLEAIDPGPGDDEVSW